MQSWLTAAASALTVCGPIMSERRSISADNTKRYRSDGRMTKFVSPVRTAAHEEVQTSNFCSENGVKQRLNNGKYYKIIYSLYRSSLLCEFLHKLQVYAVKMMHNVVPMQREIRGFIPHQIFRIFLN